jgi:hypothetical protein
MYFAFSKKFLGHRYGVFMMPKIWHHSNNAIEFKKWNSQWNFELHFGLKLSNS